MNRKQKRKKQKKAKQQNKSTGDRVVSGIKQSQGHIPHTQSLQPKLILSTFPILLWTFVKRAWVFGLGLSALIGFAYQFRPQLSIEPSFLLNYREPFSAYFRVQNTGWLSIHDLTFSCKLTGGPIIDVETTRFRGQESVKILAPGASATKHCSVRGFVFDGPAILTLRVDFRPNWWLRRESREESFSAIQDSEGIFHWTHQPK